MKDHVKKQQDLVSNLSRTMTLNSDILEVSFVLGSSLQLKNSDHLTFSYTKISIPIKKFG